MPAGLTFEQRLELLLQRQFEVAVARRQALRILFDLGPRRRGRGAEGPVQYLARLTRFLTDAGATERLRCTPDEAARVLFGIAQATFLPWILESDLDVAEPARHASHVVDLFLRGAGRPRRLSLPPSPTGAPGPTAPRTLPLHRMEIRTMTRTPPLLAALATLALACNRGGAALPRRRAPATRPPPSASAP